MSVIIEPLFSVPSVRAFRWTATRAHTGMKESFAVGRVESGRATLTLRGREHEAGPGSLHIRHPGDVHRDIGRSGPVTFTVISLAASVLEELAPVRLAPLLASADPGGAALHRLLDAAAGGVRGLALDERIAEAVGALGSLDGPCVHSRAVRRALMLLRERVTEDVALDELAAYAALDKFRLCRAFRAEIGLPPHAYLTALRVLRAKELLAAGRPPSDVASLVGFYDQSQLTRHFRRIVGTTPGRWMRERRGASSR